MARRYVALGRYVAVFALGLSVPLLDIAGPLLPQWNFLSPATWLRGAHSDLVALSKNHRYTFQVLSTDPFMVYLDGFIHPREAKYLIELGKAKFEPSKVYTDPEETEWPSPSYRTSDSSVLSSKDAIVSIIRDRAYFVLGFLPHIGVEAFQLVRYHDGDLFGMHYDWFKQPLPDGNTSEYYNRLASFFLYLEADCKAGSTYFPHLPPPPVSIQDDNTGRYSTTKNGTGLAVLPRLGSGLFWQNLHRNGTGDERLLHAGLPVIFGSKIGMNIWIKGRVALP
ncbi:2OG-Fe(II) oxygenase family oxidoreductase [Lasiosphaeria ovina]|uniref:2OG-Fe(II) oxygenase family oxidoreductase n=1 Tax=Lasiosphaeria ovina TaxID=92902 RepID=A0AAE0MXL2_9PEZI|nr:2OG-Fe(II) oxygenase family oxidoreductase [Lasiosphaeria ovina]